jgi:hypothetical protein
MEVSHAGFGQSNQYGEQMPLQENLNFVFLLSAPSVEAETTIVRDTFFLLFSGTEILPCDQF